MKTNSWYILENLNLVEYIFFFKFATAKSIGRSYCFLNWWAFSCDCKISLNNKTIWAEMIIIFDLKYIVNISQDHKGIFYVLLTNNNFLECVCLLWELKKFPIAMLWWNTLLLGWTLNSSHDFILLRNLKLLIEWIHCFYEEQLWQPSAL